jgi:phage terminase large subunit-like protein
VWCQKSRDLYESLTTGFGARKEHLTLLISTQGNQRQGLLWERYQYGCGVRDGTIDDPKFLPIIFEAPEDADWQSEETWRQAMPALGDFCSLDFIREEFERAKTSPSAESSARQFYLNQVVARETKWLPRAKWDLCGKLPHDGAKLEGKPIWWGLDLSNVSDITALVGVTEDWQVVCHCWLPENYAEKRTKRDNVPYLTWAKQGFIRLTPGDVIDYQLVKDDIVAICKQYKTKKISIDPFNATQISLQLAAERLPVELFRQGFLSMNDPVKYTSVLIATERLRHGNNPVLNWCADNAVAVHDRAGNEKICRTSSRDKVDCLVGLLMGVAGVMTHVRKRVTVAVDPPLIAAATP